MTTSPFFSIATDFLTGSENTFGGGDSLFGWILGSLGLVVGARDDDGREGTCFANQIIRETVGRNTSKNFNTVF